MSFDVSSLLSKVSPWGVKILPYAIATAMAIAWFVSYTNNVKREATAEADKRWEKRLSEFDEFARKRVSNIYDASSSLAVNAQAASTKQLAETRIAMAAISSSAEAGKYIVLKDGKCTFTPEYVKAFEAVRNTLPRTP